MEEYIRKLLEQIRFEKAHKAIGDEIRSHIEDQIEYNISDGMDKDTAEKKAVEDMGDPVEAGISLDRVHRPQIAWGVVVVAILVGIIGAAIRILVIKDIAGEGNRVLVDATGQYLIGSGNFYVKYFKDVVIGIALMLLLYFIDYTTVAKHSEVLAVLLIATYLIAYYGNYYYRVIMIKKEIINESQVEAALEFTKKAVGVSYTLMFLLIPLYAGILYKYRGQSYGGLIKALFWIFLPRLIPFVPFQYYNMRAFIVVGSMLVQLTYAIHKGWIKVRRIPSIISVWSAYAVYLLYFTRSEVAYGYYNSNTDKIKAVIDSIKVFGGGRIYIGDMAMKVKECISSPEGSYVLTYVSAVWGLVIGLAVVTIVAALITFGFVTISKTKNQLGQVMGIGCMMWLAGNAIANIVVGFGIVPEFYASFFPFISDNNIILSYVFLGVLISVYKYKNAYSQHVEIWGCKKVKELDL